MSILSSFISGFQKIHLAYVRDPEMPKLWLPSLCNLALIFVVSRFTFIQFFTGFKLSISYAFIVEKRNITFWGLKTKFSQIRSAYSFCSVPFWIFRHFVLFTFYLKALRPRYPRKFPAFDQKREINAWHDVTKTPFPETFLDKIYWNVMWGCHIDAV